MLHRDGPGTEESSPSPLTPGGPPLEMGREVRATEGRPEEARMDLGAVLQPHSTDEGENRRAPARGGHGIHWPTEHTGHGRGLSPAAITPAPLHHGHSSPS